MRLGQAVPKHIYVVIPRGWLPVPGIADVKIVGELGQSLLGHTYEFFSEVNPVWGNAYSTFRSPTHQTIQQVTVGASYVQQAAVGLYGLEDRASFGAPTLRTAMEAGLLDGIVRPEIGGFEGAKLLLVVGWKFSVVAHGWDLNEAGIAQPVSPSAAATYLDGHFTMIFSLMNMPLGS